MILRLTKPGSNLVKRAFTLQSKRDQVKPLLIAFTGLMSRNLNKDATDYRFYLLISREITVAMTR